jgi:endoglucanase
MMLALGLGGMSLSWLGCGGGKDSSGSDDGGSELSGSTGAAATRFLDRYVTDDGRVSRLDQGGDTVGEGQAYGMLIAAAAGDEKRFDSMWAWTKDNIQRPDGLLSFLWRDGKVVDPQAASDADVDAARALLAGSCRFNRPGLRKEALDLADAFMANETASFQGADVLVAGPWARKDPITVNPSYFSPATFAALGTASGDGRWGSMSATSRTVTDLLMQPKTPLPPDWAQVEGNTVVPIGSPGQPGGRPLFGFDAARTLVRLAEDPDPAGRRIAARAWPVFEGRKPADIPVEHELSGKPAGSSLHPVVLVAAAGAADAAGQTGQRDSLLAAAEKLDKRSPTYYGAAWVALGRIMLTTDALNCS